MEHTKHLWRVALLVIGLIVFYSIGRHFLVPATFGDEGFYRAQSRTEFMHVPVVHGADRRSCAACHEEEQDTHDGGKHSAVTCEVCHAPLSEHARDGEKIADMPTNPSRALCQLCHMKLEARPKEFPQIEPRAHMEELGVLEPGDPVPDRGCGLCHPAHDPAQE